MTDPLFYCEHCDYIGSEGLFHMRGEHPTEWENRPMPRHEITRRIEFDAGHRVYGHESKCAHVHGHRYQVLITCRPANNLDKLGRVVDFGVIKEKVGKFIDDSLDHGMLLFRDDPLREVWVSEFDQYSAVDAQKYYIMDDNPTAENIAKLIYLKACELLKDYGIKMVKVTVFETPNCQSSYSE